jgi:splicing factor 3A subunit 2
LLKVALRYKTKYKFKFRQKPRVQPRKTIKIGRPGYRVTKQRDPENGQRSLLFEIEYPEIEDGMQPRHRFMSAYEQRKEQPDKNYQYVSPPLMPVILRCMC